jgi:hypothetical protein
MNLLFYSFFTLTLTIMSDPHHQPGILGISLTKHFLDRNTSRISGFPGIFRYIQEKHHKSEVFPAMGGV